MIYLHLIWLYVCRNFYQLFKEHRIKFRSSLNVGQRMSIIILLASVTVVDRVCAFGRGFRQSRLPWLLVAQNIYCWSDWEGNVRQSDVWRVSRRCYVTYNFSWSKTRHTVFNKRSDKYAANNFMRMMILFVNRILLINISFDCFNVSKLKCKLCNNFLIKAKTYSMWMFAFT